MMLALVRSSFGKTLVAEISNQFILERVRDGYDRQHIPVAARLGFNHSALVDIAALMEANFEEPLTAVELAKLARLSLRQVQRMFHESLETTPTKYYLQLRLRRARRAAFAVPDVDYADLRFLRLQSTCHFSKSYRALYGRTPRSERQPQNSVQEFGTTPPLRKATNRARVPSI